MVWVVKNAVIRGMSEMINERVRLKNLRNKALQNGMVPLQLDGIEKVKAGIISVEEALRITQTIDNRDSV